jgi:NAD(P)H-dependent FMN reductase
MMPAGSELRIESIAGIPLYDGDAEDEHGIPPAVTHLKDAIAAADGLLLVTPEYNNAMPGVAKNAMDWLTRPPEDSARVFRGRPVALTGASPGRFGTVLSQNSWLPVFRTLGADLWTGRLMVSGAEKVFDAKGEMVDAAMRELTRKFVEGFVAYRQERK